MVIDFSKIKIDVNKFYYLTSFSFIFLASLLLIEFIFGVEYNREFFILVMLLIASCVDGRGG